MSRDGGGGSSSTFPRRGVSSRTLPVLRAAAASCIFPFDAEIVLGLRSELRPPLRFPAPVLPCSFEMGNSTSVKTEASDSAEQPATPAPAPETKPKKKICCACPDTKKLRDDCIVQNGEDACGKFIEAHLQCLRAEGFNV